MPPAAIMFPHDVSGGSERDPDSEPFGPEARPGIATRLTEPVRAEGLDRARQENHGEPGREKDSTPHRRLQRRDLTGTRSRNFAFTRVVDGARPGEPASRAPGSRTAHGGDEFGDA